MSDANDTVQTVDTEAIAKAERERIQSIESLTNMSEGKHPSIVAAVRGKIDGVKFDAGMTKESAEILVLQEINTAQSKLISQMEADHKNVNAVAEHASIASGEEAQTTEQMKRESRADGLVAAAKELNK